MNVNFNQFRKQDAGETPTLMNVLRESASVLAKHEDTRPIGPPILVPAKQAEYPGAYEVWYPVQGGGWIWIDHHGVKNTADQIAGPDDSSWAESW